MKPSLKDTILDFFVKMLSVVLGIVITFSVQGIINRAQSRRNVRSGLELVRTELTANIDDIRTMTEYLDEERASARYLFSHRNELDRCPADSVNYHAGVIFADASITLSRDALDLLTVSTLFPKIGNNQLSMKIIRAYDTCQSISAVLNQHVTNRNNRFEASVNDKTAALFASDGTISIKDYIKTAYGFYAIRWITSQASIDQYADVSDIEDALAAINAYLKD